MVTPSDSIRLSDVTRISGRRPHLDETFVLRSRSFGTGTKSKVRTAYKIVPKGRRLSFMKLFRMCAAAVAALMMSISAADAGGLLSHFKLGGCGAEKSCGCAETCQPTCCKPTIARPCCTNTYVYQRQCSNIKPPCCDTCCPDTGCCPADACGDNACAPECCAPAACCAPEACAPTACCAPADSCSPDCCCPAPADCCAPAACCAPADCCAPAACCAPAECCVPADCCAPAECCVVDCAAPAECCAPAETCCDTGCESKGCGLLSCSLFSGKKSCLFGGCCKQDDCCGDTCAPADCWCTG